MPAKFTAKQLTGVKLPQTKLVPPSPQKNVTVRIPSGGEATIRPVKNGGMIVHTRNENWKTQDEVFVEDPSKIKFEK